MSAAAPAGDLTARQREILAFVVAHQADHGYPPSLRAVMDRFGIRSPNGMLCHFKALEKKGYIRRQFRAARAITILRRPDGSPCVPAHRAAETVAAPPEAEAMS